MIYVIAPCSTLLLIRLSLCTVSNVQKSFVGNRTKSFPCIYLDKRNTNNRSLASNAVTGLFKIYNRATYTIYLYRYRKTL